MSLSADAIAERSEQARLYALAQSGDACPVCKSLKAVTSNLVICYSTCCGKAACTDCIEKLFTSRLTIQCPDCSNQLKKQFFVSQPLDKQKYTKEARIRKQYINTVFVLERQDFNTKDDYDAYLELQTDCAYDLTYGTPAEALLAREKIDNFAVENKSKINLALRRQALQKAGESAIENDLLPSISAAQAIHSQKNAEEIRKMQSINKYTRANVPTSLLQASANTTFTIPSLVNNFVREFRSQKEFENGMAELEDEELKRIKTEQYKRMLIISKKAGGFREEELREKDLYIAFSGLECT